MGERLREDDRGQTLQDYVIGVSLFVLLAFVALGVFPQVLASFDQGTEGDARAQADRVARQIVTNTSVPGSPNELNATAVGTVTTRDEDELRERFALPSTANLNVTVETLSGGRYVVDASGRTLAGEPPQDGGAVVSSSRIVTLSDRSCPTACRLVVRVW